MILHHVYANKSNLGDWLSALGIQSLLPEFTIREYLCDEPFVEKTLAALEKADPSDAVIIGGGGLFMDYFRPFWEGFLNIGGRVPFFIWGAGLCDHKKGATRISLDILSRVIDKSRLCVVRDELTREYLSDVSVQGPAACPSLMMISEPSSPGFGVLHVVNYGIAGEKAYGAMRKTAETFAKNSGRPYREVNNRIHPGDREALNRILSLYADSDIIVSSALHGCIIGSAMGKKVLAVSGDWKIESFMGMAGLKDWVIDIDYLEELDSKISELPEQQNCLNRLAPFRDQNRNIADNIRAILQAAPPGKC